MAFVIVSASCWTVAQTVGPFEFKVPRIVLQVEDDLPSHDFWIRYSLSEEGGGVVKIKTDPGRRQYVIYGAAGATPVQSAKIFIYARGCQFKTYDLELGGSSGTVVPFGCTTLPTTTVHAFLPPAQIPHNSYTQESNLDIFGELDGSPICDFLLTSTRSPTAIQAGSCLGSGIPLGTVGEIDPLRGGAFDITIPDFALDPLFKSIGGIPRTGEFGVIELSLRVKLIERPLGTIKSEGTDVMTGLRVRAHYPDPVLFQRLH